jgi:hypothetical protein
VKLPRSAFDLLFGGTDDAPAGDNGALIAPAVALVPLLCPVVLAVDLDDQPLRPPHEVGHDHQPPVAEVKPRVDLRPRQSQRAAEREHRLLDLAPGQRRTDVVLREDRSDDLRAPARGVPIQLVPDRPQVEQL